MSDIRLVTYPVPVRDDLIAELRLPIDLTEHEADHICGVIRTLVAPAPGEEGQ